MFLKPVSKQAIFSPDSIRVIVDGKTYRPSTVTAGKVTMEGVGCGDKDFKPIDGATPLTIDGPFCVRFDFADLYPPERSFSVVSRELPEITYSVKRKTVFGIGLPR